jgi:hypothetical protein
MAREEARAPSSASPSSSRSPPAGSPRRRLLRHGAAPVARGRAAAVASRGPMRPVPLASALVLALLLGGTETRAQTNPHPWRIADEYGQVVMRLRYAPPNGCPNEDAMEGAVPIAVPEWHPFAPDAPWILVVDVRRRPQGWEGTAELRDAAGDGSRGVDGIHAREVELQGAAAGPRRGARHLHARAAGGRRNPGRVASTFFDRCIPVL